MKVASIAALAFGLALAAGQAFAGTKTLVISIDGYDPTARLAAVRTFEQITYRNTDAGLTLADLAGYDSVLAYTNMSPADATNFGDVLKGFADGGGRVVLATYALSDPWAIHGGIMGAGYAPLVSSGANGSVTGALNQLAPDAIFNDVNLAAVSFFNNSNYALPTLAAGATLLADDGAGVAMIARNAGGNVYAFNIFPGDIGTNNETYKLFGNALLGGGGSAGVVPEPGAWALMILGFGSAGAAIRRRRETVPA